MKFYEKELTAHLDIKLFDILKDFDSTSFTIEKALWIDIETTGFSPSSAYVYLIGCIHYTKQHWTLSQWFLDDVTTEKELLCSFAEFLTSFSYFIHFNGGVFDIPFLEKRMKRYQISTSLFLSLKNFDLYKQTRPLKNLLHLSSLKQKDLEAFFSIHRKDVFNGRELINIYEAYLEYPTSHLLDCLLLHNAEDLEGMLSIFPIFTYTYFLSGGFLIEDCQIECMEKNQYSLAFLLSLFYPLPKSIACHWGECTLAAREKKVSFHVSLFYGELKYFYSNYKDYYYLPEEDRAIHKSVAAYVDKNYRQKAKASNCYTKKTAYFLPQLKAWKTPAFQETYHADCFYFELTDEFLKRSELQKEYLIYQFSKIKINK